MRILLGFGLLGNAVIERFAPGWTGFFTSAVEITPGESRIVQTLFLVGAFIVFAMCMGDKK